MVRNSLLRGAAVSCVLVLVASACGSDEKDSQAEPAETTAPAVVTEATEAPVTVTDVTEAPDSTTEVTEAPSDDPLGTPTPASGDPVRVGYVWAGVAPTIDNSADEIAADAITEWINEYGGGIGGRPLELVKCATNSDVSIAATCGSAMLEADVPAVLFNVVGEVEPWATPILAAGVPIVAYASVDAVLMTPDAPAFILSNPSAVVGLFPAAIAKEQGAKHSAILVIDVPGASGPALAAAPPTFEGMGAGTVNVVPISPTAPDHGPAVQVELQNNPEVVHIIGNPAFCSLSIRALKDAGYTGTITMISNCVDDALKEQLGSDLEGIYVSYGAGEDPSNADYQLFTQILDRYATTKVVPSGTPVGSWVTLEGFRRVMADFTGEFTPEAITAHIRGHEALPLPDNDAGVFKCDGQAVPGLAIACTSSFTYSVLDAEGNPTTFTGFGA